MSAITDVRITILADNKAGPRLSSGKILGTEHGFALWIEAFGKRILFDTGAGGVLTANAAALGADLNKTDMLILSHGHYDHTGGLPGVLAVAPNAEVYAHPGVMETRYTVRDGKAKRVSLSGESFSALRGLPTGRLHWVTAPVRISEKVGLTGPVPRLTDYEDTGGPFFLDTEGTRPDPIEDDMALWIGTDSGLVVCAGCSHAGIVNTLDYIRQLNSVKHIRTVIGGFHLKDVSDNRIDKTTQAMFALEPEVVVPCHCTGDKAVAALRDVLGEIVTAGAVGRRYRYSI